ncbi:MAG: hypothetical protein JXR71_03665 [Bacteroidales bacterium]|nr:hypothetical protein [Bacteroidales bacterium]
MSLTVLLLILVLGIGQSASGQGKAVISAGFGIPELLNVGAQYQFHQCQLGFSVGTFPVSGRKLMSISGDFRYHFAGYSDVTSLRTFYGKLGLTYLSNDVAGKIGHYVYLNTRIGNDFNITHKFGITVDIGVLYEIDQKIIQVSNDCWYLPMNWRISPSVGIGLFYKL